MKEAVGRFDDNRKVSLDLLFAAPGEYPYYCGAVFSFPERFSMSVVRVGVDVVAERIAHVFDRQGVYGRNVRLQTGRSSAEVEVFGHGIGPLFSMGPDCRANVVDQFAVISFFAQSFSQANVEARVVDEHDPIRFGAHDVVANYAELLKQLGQCHDDVGKSHHLKVFHGQRARTPLRASYADRQCHR